MLHIDRASDLLVAVATVHPMRLGEKDGQREVQSYFFIGLAMTGLRPNYEKRDGPAIGGRKGIRAGRGDLREIPDRGGLSDDN